jgi:hypothetical protein
MIAHVPKVATAIKIPSMTSPRNQIERLATFGLSSQFAFDELGQFDQSNVIGLLNDIHKLRQDGRSEIGK